MDDFIEMEQMERDYYCEEFIAPAKEAMSWYKEHPFSVKVVEANGEIAGFMNLFPVVPSVAAAILDGEFNDHDLITEDIQSPFEAKGSLQLFLSCLVVRENQRHKGVVTLLMNSYIKEIDSWKTEISDVLMETVTLEGNQFAAHIGMEKVKVKPETVVWKTTYERLKGIFR